MLLLQQDLMLETQRNADLSRDLRIEPVQNTHPSKNILHERQIQPSIPTNHPKQETTNFEKRIKRTTCCIFKKINAQQFSSDKFLLNRPNLLIYVKMHKRLPYGKALYLVGNSKQLGDWNIEDGLKLDWSEEDVWRGSVVMAGSEDIEYKYVIADFNDGLNPEWESGCNRRISIGEVQGGEVYLNEKWNHEKITLELITQDADQVYVIGNVTELGNWVSKCYMRSFLHEDKNKKLWSMSFHMQKSKEYLHYYYIKKQGGLYVKEQQPGRYLHVSADLIEQQNFINRLTLVKRPGEIKILDSDTFKEFKISEITEELTVGPYVRKEQEVIQLAKKKVRSVLSLQSKQDMARCGIDWPKLLELYKKHGIKAINIEIIDRKSTDFISKSGIALKMLDVLVQKYKKVYVHCTAGIFRSPQLIVLYLARFRDFTLQDAIELVKRRRPFARPENECLQSSLNILDADKQNLNTLKH